MYLRQQQIVTTTTKQDIVDATKTYFQKDYTTSGMMLPVIQTIEDCSAKNYITTSKSVSLQLISAVDTVRENSVAGTIGLSSSTEEKESKKQKSFDPIKQKKLDKSAKQRQLETNVIDTKDASDRLPPIDPKTIPNISDKIERVNIDLTFKQKTENDKKTLQEIDKHVKFLFYNYQVYNGNKVKIVLFFPIGVYSILYMTKQQKMLELNEKTKQDSEKMKQVKNLEEIKLEFLSAFTSSLLQRGTRSLTVDDIEKKFDDLDADVSFGFDNYNLNVYVEAKPDQIAEVCKLAIEMLFYSKFTRDTFNELKSQLKQAIVDERQDTDARAAKILSRQLYPLNHRLRSTETQKQLEVLGQTTFEDVVWFAKKYLKLTNDYRVIKVGAKSNVYPEIYIASAFVNTEIVKSLQPLAEIADAKKTIDVTKNDLKDDNDSVVISAEQGFLEPKNKIYSTETSVEKDSTSEDGDSEKSSTFVAFPLEKILAENGSESIVKAEKVKTLIVDIPEKTNTRVLIGQRLDILRTNPDFVLLEIAVRALGGDFSARLMNRVRVKEGLTYGK